MWLDREAEFVSSLKTMVGNNLRQARRARGWTLERLAGEAGVSVETVSRIERGQSAPSFDTVELLAGTLAVRPERLFGLAGDADPASPRGQALHRLHDILANATDGQVELVAGLAELVATKGPR